MKTWLVDTAKWIAAFAVGVWLGMATGKDEEHARCVQATRLCAARCDSQLAEMRDGIRQELLWKCSECAEDARTEMRLGKELDGP